MIGELSRALPPGDLEGHCEAAANALLEGKSHLKLLEAGCGSASHISFNGSVYIVGIDIAKEELEQNQALHEKILGDLQTYPLPEAAFDVAICWMVLEHLPRPKEALKNLFRTVKPGGLLILGFPNLFSIKGVVTKATPFWFHEFFYHIMHYTSRHFPTYLRAAILPKRLIRLAMENGFSLEYSRLVQGAVTVRARKRFWFVDMPFGAIDAITRLLSFGKVQSPLLDNCGMIFKKSAS